MVEADRLETLVVPLWEGQEGRAVVVLGVSLLDQVLQDKVMPGEQGLVLLVQPVAGAEVVLVQQDLQVAQQVLLEVAPVVLD